MTAPTTGTALNTSELRAMLAAATPGPWEVMRSGAVVSAERAIRDTVANTFPTGNGPKHNAALIAAAVNNLEALLDAADERDALRAAVEDMRAKWSGCWCPQEQYRDHDPRVRDCPQHGSGDCRHMAEGITVDARAALAAAVGGDTE